jgi:hypothetical protein
MKKPDAATSIKIYKQFTAHAKKAVTLFEICRRLPNDVKFDIPAFKQPPSHVIESLEKYLVIS